MILSRVVRALWRHGPVGTFRLARGALFPNVRFLVLFGLERPRRMPDADQPIELHFATRDEVARLPPEIMKRDTLALFDRGDRCLAQTIDGRLAGVVWFSTATEVELHAGVRITIPPDVAYTYRTWTATEFQGLALQGRRHLSVLDAVRTEGRSRLLCFSDGANLASLRGVRKSGCRPIGRLWARKTGDARAVLRITAPAWSDVRLAPAPRPPESGRIRHT